MPVLPCVLLLRISHYPLEASGPSPIPQLRVAYETQLSALSLKKQTKGSEKPFLHNETANTVEGCRPLIFGVTETPVPVATLKVKSGLLGLGNHSPSLLNRCLPRKKNAFPWLPGFEGG